MVPINKKIDVVLKKLEKYGRIQNVVKNISVTQVEYICDNFPIINIDFSHNYNFIYGDFTVNNFEYSKLPDNLWLFDCVTKLLDHRPELSKNDIFEICITDAKNKKINMMMDPIHEERMRPKFFARTCKLLHRNYTLTEPLSMITKTKIQMDRFLMKPKYSDVCSICCNSCETNYAVLDCGHAMHPKCMQVYYVYSVYGNCDENNNTSEQQRYVLGPNGFGYVLVKTKKMKSVQSIVCPLCKNVSTFLEKGE